MAHTKIVWAILLVMGFCLSLLPTYAEKQGRNNTSFLSVYEAVKAGKDVSITDFKDHPLYPHLEYEKINKKLGSASDEIIKRYIETYPNTWMAEKLWVHWLKRLSTREKWNRLIDVYSEDADSTAARCLYLEATLKTEAQNPKNTELALEQWMSAKPLPPECGTLADYLMNQGDITKKEIWQRIDLAIEAGQTKLIRTLASKLENDEEKIARLLALSHRSPEKALRSKNLGTGKYSRKVMIHSVKRITRKNRKKGKKRWASLQNKAKFTDAEKANVNAYIAIRDALAHEKQALKQFVNIPAEYREDEANKWMARMALRDGNWKKLLSALDGLSLKEADRDVWKYWRARAYERTGKKKEAKRIYTSLSQDASFYGFLAADRVQQPYHALNDEDHVRDRSICVENIKELPPVKRAIHWFKLDENGKAKKEWFWSIKHLNKEGQLTLAALALEMDKPLLAVSTVSRTKDWNQIRLRFPLLYKKLITQMAKENNVTPAWVYGIMRRESVFNDQAISHAKAMGLMQILPSTARHVARKLGFKVVKSDLLTPEVNVKLGSAYLNQMLKAHDGSYIEATAAYNAGPGRVKRWKPKTTIDADRWVESIPFTETRKYVRAVMSYTTIYDHKLTDGNGKRISHRIKPIDTR